MLFLVAQKQLTDGSKSERYFGNFRFEISWKRHNLCIHRLSLRYSRPSSLHNFSLDVPLIAPVIARVALYRIDSRLSMNFSLQDLP